MIPLCVVRPAYAADLEMSLRTSITVTNLDRLGEVSQSITLTNRSGATVPGELALPVFGSDIKALSVASDDAGSVSASYDDQRGVITLNPAFLPQAAETSRTFNVTYSSQISEVLGASTLLLMPATPDDVSGFVVTSESRTLRLDLGVGLATRIGPVEPTVSISIGQQVLNWSQPEGPIGSPTGVALGEGTLAEVKIETTLKNSGPWWKMASLPLPPETNQQRTFLVDIQPRPHNVRVDLDGNIIAEFRLAPLQSKKITATAIVLIKNYNYALENAAKENTLPEDFSGLDHFLASTDRWPANPLEVEATSTPLEIVRRALGAVAENSFNQDDSYSKALAQSNYLVGTLRGAGLPARVILGVLADSDASQRHAWAEVFLSGLGWISVDPSDQSGSVATTDVRYVALAIRGEQDDYPTPRSADTAVAYQNDTQLPKSEEKPTISSTNYMVLPGVAIRISRINMPPGLITDLTAIEFDGDRLNHLGSLAPLQRFVSRDLMLGSAAFKSVTVNFGIFSDDALSKVVSVESMVSWIPMIAEGILIVLAIAGWLGWRRYRDSRPLRPKHTAPIQQAVSGIQDQPELQTPKSSAPTPEASQQPVAPIKATATIPEKKLGAVTSSEPPATLAQIEHHKRQSPRQLQVPRANGRPPKHLIQ